MSDEQLRALEAELVKRLNTTYVRVQPVRWIEDVDDEGDVYHIPVLDEFGIGEDAMLGVTWLPAGSAKRSKAKTTQIINLELLDEVGPEKLAEILAPDLEYSFALLLASDEEQD